MGIVAQTIDQILALTEERGARAIPQIKSAAGRAELGQQRPV
jgi:hypothetical protein